MSLNLSSKHLFHNTFSTLDIQKLHVHDKFFFTCYSHPNSILYNILGFCTSCISTYLIKFLISSLINYKISLDLTWLTFHPNLAYAKNSQVYTRIVSCTNSFSIVFFITKKIGRCNRYQYIHHSLSSGNIGKTC